MKPLALLLLSLALVACGGGCGDSPNAPTDNNTEAKRVEMSAPIATPPSNTFETTGQTFPDGTKEICLLVNGNIQKGSCVIIESSTQRR